MSNALVCPECGSGIWDLEAANDEIVVCDHGHECCLSDLVPWNEWEGAL